MAIATSPERLRQKLRLSLYQNAIYLMINTALAVICGLAFWLVPTRWAYQTEDVGRASAVISAIMLC